MIREFNPEKAIKAQVLYCLDNDLPLLFPSTGICRNCQENIFYDPGISVQEASETHITECPFCLFQFHIPDEYIDDRKEYLKY